MWQSGSGRKYKRKKPGVTNQSTSSNRKTKIPLFHIKRVAAQIKVTPSQGSGGIGGKLEPARVILNDFRPKFVHLFVTRALQLEQEVALLIEHPKHFYCRGKVASCQEVSEPSHILAEESFVYRVQIEFIFTSDDERKEVEKYCEEINEQEIQPKKPAQKAA